MKLEELRELAIQDLMEHHNFTRDSAEKLCSPNHTSNHYHSFLKGCDHSKENVE